MVERLTSDSGFNTLKCLVFFRDPVSHSISTYAHRAQRGRAGVFSEWIENKYETLSVMEGFLHEIDQSKVDWSIRKYISDSDYLIRATFDDWLKVKGASTMKAKRVNESLTLFEIEFISTISSGLSLKQLGEIRKRLREIERKMKPDDRATRELYEVVAYNFFANKTAVIKKANSYLAQNEQLTLPKVDCDIENLMINQFIQLNKIQLEAIKKAIRDSSKPLTLQKRMFLLYIRTIKAIRRSAIYRNLKRFMQDFLLPYGR
jgi:hypothetical protein